MLKSQSGVGLIEIVIAMLIFGIGISAAMRTLPDSNMATTRARNLSVATNLAQEQLEALMGTPLTSAELSAGTHVDPRNPLERHFTRTWIVTDNVPLTGMKRVVVSVVYAGGSDDRTVTLTTYLTPRR
ncbi:type II secretion system GspH family protein [Candidatus Uhrbacteria bacterium]|nr:type II secretion system GspH family protein [Candidatus Uhrbacteria bacterium]